MIAAGIAKFDNKDNNMLMKMNWSIFSVIVKGINTVDTRSG